MQRWRSASVALALVVATTATGLVAPARVDAAVGGGCLRVANPPPGESGAYYCDTWTTAAGARGSIALLGDSVLLGSSPTVSTPSLVDLLARNGWGPIRMTAGVGLQTEPGGPGRAPTDIVAQWQREGVHPTVAAINLGAGFLVPCGADVRACSAAINSMVDAVFSRWPSAVIWWPEIVHHLFPSGAPSDGMLNWNRTLRAVAAAHPGRMVVWDWPAALVASGIVTDFGDVHPANPTEFAKRSALIAAHITAYAPARYTGPHVAVPTARAGSFELVPQRDPVVGSLAPLALTPGVVRAVSLRAALPAATGSAGAVLAVSTSAPSAGGWVKVHECGRPAAVAAQLVFATGPAGDATQAYVPLGANATVCMTSNVAVTVRVAVQAGLAGDGGLRFSPLTPAAAAVGSTATPTVLRITNPALVGARAASVTVTVDGASGGGRLTLHECGRPPAAASTVEFAAGRPRSGAAMVPVRDGAVCATTAFTGTPPRVRVAVTGVFTSATTGARFRFATAVTRLLDMRPTARRGGWVGRHVVAQRIGVPAAPRGAVAMVGRLIADAPLESGELLVHPSATPGALQPALAFVRGVTTAAPLTVAVNASGTVDLVMRRGNAQTALDVVGWWSR